MNVKTRPFRRWMALFLCVVMCMSLLPAEFAFAENEEEIIAADGQESNPVEFSDDEFAEEPVVEEPVVEEPVIEEPVVEEPVVEESVVEEPVVEEPVVEEPVVEEPVVEEPVVEEPVVEEPVVEEPVVEEPVVEEPVVEEPVVEEPVVEEPAVEEPVVEEPVVGEPVVEEPAAEALVTVSFKTVPEDAEITVYTKNDENEKEIIIPEQDGNYLLAPGNYFYDAYAAGFVSVEEELLEVKAPESEDVFEVEVLLTEETAEEPPAEAPVLEETLVKVVFKTEPQEAAVTVYSVNEAGEKQITAVSEDGSYLLTPGIYSYEIKAEGFAAVEETMFEVVASEEPVVLTVVLEEETVTEEVGGVKASEEPKKALDTVELKSVSKDGSRLLVRWLPVAGASRYRVYRGGSMVGETESNTLTYSDGNVSNGNSYTYYIIAVQLNDAGAVVAKSPKSNEITATYYDAVAPKVTSVTVTTSGLRITWSGSAGRYQLFRKPAGGSYARIAIVDGSSYTDEQVVSGNTYTYRVRSLNWDNVVISDYSDASKATTFYGYVKVKSLTNGVSQIKVEWNGVTGVSSYRIQRRADNTGWRTVGSASGTSFVDTDVTSGVRYTYRVMCVNAEGKIIGTYDEDGVSINFYDAPELKKADITLTSKGITIYWTPVTGVSVYRVFRKVGNGSYSMVADVTKGTTYADNNVAAGVKYTYAVQCRNSNNTANLSALSKGATVAWTKQPVLKSAVPAVNGIKITWEKVDGVDWYRVYRKAEGSTTWYALEDALNDVNGTTVVDTYAASRQGVRFTYTVRCVTDDGGDEYSAYDAKGVTCAFYSQPILLRAKSVPSGLEITWKEIEGVSKYRVYRRTKSEDGSSVWSAWKVIGDVSGTTYTDMDSKLTSGKKYYYTVCALDSNNEVASVKGKAGSGKDYVVDTFYGAPKLLTIEAVYISGSTDGIRITWETVGDAVKYRIYRKTSNTTWKKNWKGGSTVDVTIPEGATEGSYTDTSVVSGTKYYYSVCCLRGSELVSTYDPIGLSLKYYAMPKLPSLEREARGIKVSWPVVDGVTRYRIWRREANTEWINVGETSGTSFTDKKVVSGATYIYSIQCISNDGKKILSAFNKTGRTIKKFMFAPTLSSVTGVERLDPGAAAANKITFTEVERSNYYSIYRKIGTGKWKRIGVVQVVSGGATVVSGSIKIDSRSGGSINVIDEITSLSYNGKQFAYKVRCSTSTGKSGYSAFSGTKSYTILNAPSSTLSPVKFSRKPGNTTVKWRAVDGATGYKVYRRLEGSNSWKLMTTIYGSTQVSWKDEKVIKNQKYFYTVQAIKGDQTSGFNSKGRGTIGK